MSKLTNYLAEHLRGEVVSATGIRAEFAHDQSILAITPDMVVYPYNVSDIRKLARFTWQLAEKGHVLPIIPRGGGTDTTGAAIGKGVVVATPAHMNTIFEFDTKQRLVRVQPGLECHSLLSTMKTHGYTLPVLEDAPAGMTIGGAIAQNFTGGNATKYGAMRDWIEQIEVILANGEVIQTGRLGKRDVEKRKGLPTLEGEIYRQIDGIIEENSETIREMADTISNVGYGLDQVKRKDGSVDLMPLFAGSQGTLGIISEVILKIAPYNPQSELVAVAFATIPEAHDALDELRKLQPSKIEMLDGPALEVMSKQQMPRLVELFGESFDLPATLYFIEFDDKHAAKHAKKVEKMFSRSSMFVQRTDGYDQRMAMWQLYNGAVALFKTADKDGRVALPIIHDVAIPDDKLQTYLEGVAMLARKNRTSWPIWGHVIDGRFSVMPALDLRRVSDRQKALKLMDDYYSMTAELGGVLASTTGEGRLHISCAAKQYSTELLGLFTQVRSAFDPYNTLNPGVKQGTDLKALVALVRDGYQGLRFY